MENSSPVASESGQDSRLLAFRQILSSMCKDMQFLGILSIIAGALNCLSIIGAIIGVPIIFTGLRLRESSDAFQAYATTNDENALQKAIERLSRFFYIYKILAIIYLVLIGLMILFWIIMAAIGGLGMMELMDY